MTLWETSNTEMTAPPLCVGGGSHGEAGRVQWKREVIFCAAAMLPSNKNIYSLTGDFGNV